MDDPKIFRKNFLAQMILNSPIRIVIMVKVRFEDLRIFFTTRSTRLDTQNFLETFFGKNFWLKGFNSKSYHDFHPLSYSLTHFHSLHHSHIYTHRQTSTLSLTLAHTHTHTLTHNHTHTHTHTYTHTHTRAEDMSRFYMDSEI